MRRSSSGTWRPLAATVAVAALLSTSACTQSPSRPEPPAVANLFPEPFPEPAQAVLPADQVAGIEGVMDEVLAEAQRFSLSRRGAAGITVGVVSHRGSWSGAAGVDGDGASLVPEAAMGVGNVSATFLAAEVMHLAASGQLDLDRPAADYVQHPAVPALVTVRQLLGMRAGLRDAEPDPDVVGADPGRTWTPAQVLEVLAAPPEPPDADPVYASSSLMALQLVVETVTGGSLAAALRRDLLSPLGLERVSVQDVEVPVPPLGAPVSRLPLGPRDGYLPYRSMASFGGGAAGVAADAPDLARWGYELYGGLVLGMPAVTEMTNAPDAPLRDLGSAYGLGTMRFTTALGLSAVGHLGWVPGYSAALVVVPERRLSVAVLVVGDGKHAQGFVEGVVRAVLEP